MPRSVAYSHRNEWSAITAVADAVHPDVASWPSLVLVAAVSTVVSVFGRNSLIDDAYIALTYARNLAFYGHWGLLRHAFSNTATSPLNVIVLALVTVVTREPKLAMAIVFVGSNVAAYRALRRIAARDGLAPSFPLLAWALVFLNPLVVSTIGLEMTLAVALAALLLAEDGDRPAVSGALAGLLILTRPDLAIIALTLLFGRASLRRRWRTTLPAMAAVCAPWFVFSWVAFGSAIPDTLVIKLQQKAWAGGYTFANGWKWYLATFPAATVLAVAPAVAGVIALAAWAVARRLGIWSGRARLDSFAVLAAGGLLHYAAYSALGVPPYHWYYVPAIASLTMFFAAVAGRPLLADERQSSRWSSPASLIASGAVLLIAADVTFLGRGLKPLAFAPITTNWASSAQYAEIGIELRQRFGNSVIGSPGEIGGIEYYCSCFVVDAFSDRGWVPRLLQQVERERGPVTRALIDLNYRFFDRSITPRRREYVMRYVKSPSPRAVAVWPVSAPGTGPMYFALMREP